MAKTIGDIIKDPANAETLKELVKPKPTPSEALKAAPTVFEVLGHPEFYEKWYDGMRREALGNG